MTEGHRKRNARINNRQRQKSSEVKGQLAVAGVTATTGRRRDENRRLVINQPVNGATGRLARADERIKEGKNGAAGTHFYQLEVEGPPPAGGKPGPAPSSAPLFWGRIKEMRLSAAGNRSR